MHHFYLKILGLAVLDEYQHKGYGKELISALELPEEDIVNIIESMKSDFIQENRGIIYTFV